MHTGEYDILIDKSSDAACTFSKRKQIGPILHCTAITDYCTAREVCGKILATGSLAVVICGNPIATGSQVYMYLCTWNCPAAALTLSCLWIVVAVVAVFTIYDLYLVTVTVACLFSPSGNDLTTYGFRLRPSGKYFATIV